MIPSWACGFLFNNFELKLLLQKSTFTILIILKWNMLLKLLELVTNILRSQLSADLSGIGSLCISMKPAVFLLLAIYKPQKSWICLTLIYQQNFFYMSLPRRRQLRLYGYKYHSLLASKHSEKLLMFPFLFRLTQRILERKLWCGRCHCCLMSHFCIRVSASSQHSILDSVLWHTVIIR